MASFKRCTTLDGKEVYINLDTVTTIWRLPQDVDLPERTRVWFNEKTNPQGYIDVLEFPRSVSD